MSGLRICQMSHVEQTFHFLAPLCRALVADGHEVVAACNLEHDGRVVSEALGDEVARHRIVVGRKLTVAALTTDVLRLARYLRRERFDVVHVHSPLVAVQGRLAAAIARVPVVISHAHGFYFHDGMPPLRRAAHLGLERVLARYCTDYLVTINQPDHELVARHRLLRDPDRSVLVPGVGVDVDRFRPAGPDEHAPGAVRAELGIPASDPMVTFVGRIVAEKGVLELIEAFCAVVDERPERSPWLVLVGETITSERDQSTCARMGEILDRHPEAKARVLRTGRRTDVAEVLRASDVFVLPSYREGMPMSLLEAMACGVAAVTTDVRGCREAVDGGRAGRLVPAGRVAPLADALAVLLDDPAERTRLGRAGREVVESRYSVAHSLVPQTAMYRRIAAEITTGADRDTRVPLRSRLSAALYRWGRRLVPPAARRLVRSDPRWLMAVEQVESPLQPSPVSSRLIFTAERLAELGIRLVADPFALRRDGTWYLFFEQVRVGDARGEIGLATSTDLSDWTYRGVVLAESFHLSYPYVMDVAGQTYMIPETTELGQVRLYRAVEFPLRWELDSVLLDGAPFKDNSLLTRDGVHYLFSETSAHTNDLLRLYHADDLNGPWREHPASPLVSGDADTARSAGRPAGVNGRLVRFSQVCTGRYGAAVRAHAITRLTPTEYAEEPIPGRVLSGSGQGWNARAMHHVDPHHDGDGWVRFVDGHG